MSHSPYGLRDSIRKGKGKGHGHYGRQAVRSHHESCSWHIRGLQKKIKLHAKHSYINDQSNQQAPDINDWCFLCEVKQGDETRGYMAQEWAKNFYKFIRWMRCRNAYIQSRIMTDGGLCEECCCNPGYNMHHKIILTADNISYPEVGLKHSNLEYVCKDCHDLLDGHGIHQAIAPLCRFDANTRPISLRKTDKNETNIRSWPIDRIKKGANREMLSLD